MEQKEVLADDLLITSYGVGHLSRIVKTVEMSFKYFEDIGAKVADNKCFTFATNKDTRDYLKKSKFINTHRYYLKIMILMPFAS